MATWITAPSNVSLSGVQSLQLTCNVAGTARVAIPKGARDVTIVNDTATKVYLRGGDITVVADTNAMPIPAGATGTFRIAGSTHLAGQASADTVIEVIPGSGG